MAVFGYEYLRQRLKLPAFAVPQPAMRKAVTRVERTAEWLAIPDSVAPADDEPITHILFALKHEGVNLQILATAMPHIPARTLVQELHRTPNGRYIRMACFLWEYFTNKELGDIPVQKGSYIELFNPDLYVVGRARHNRRWRVNFNGLGTLAYCATVRRTPAIEAVMQSKVLERANAFGNTLDKRLMQRTLAWAYLHETRDSFAIERETPSDEKSRAFVALLHQAHSGRALSEDYLVELQSATVTNPFDKAMSFRTQQNWLAGPGRGAPAVTYVPPPPDLARELMDELMEFANHEAQDVDPIVAASVIAFAFVYIHPFMDGNGRLSRFLYHQILFQSGKLTSGLLLPISIAMKKNENRYLDVLQAWSRHAREFWRVIWLDAEHYQFKFLGDEHGSIYRYWDATECVAFCHAMTEQALDTELREETRFLARYDTILAAVDQRFDIRNSDLATLIIGCLDNNGVISKRRRRQFAERVPAAAFSYIEKMAAQTVEAAYDNDEPCRAQ